jgi:hypothetical protein
LLSGGRLSTDRLYSSVGATGSVFFDGGTLGVSSQYPTLSSNDWLGVASGSLSLLVRNGGALIDTGYGSVTVRRPFLRDGLSTGGLTKLGLNTLTLAITNAGFSACTYAGDTAVLGGTLKLGGTLAPLPAGTRMTVATDSVLDLGGAVLDGVTNIVLKAGGELTGAATVIGSLTVTFEGGVFSGSLAVSGELKVAGAVKLAMPAQATYPYYATLFSYASADQATRDALAAAATPSPLPSGLRAVVRVTAAAARLVVAPFGSVIRLY